MCFFFQAEDGIRDPLVTGVQTCALPITPEGLQNPTLHVNPGDHLMITVTNNTPALPLTMTVNPPNCGASSMGPSSLNLHYHGTNTSPTRSEERRVGKKWQPGRRRKPHT